MGGTRDTAVGDHLCYNILHIVLLILVSIYYALICALFFCADNRRDRKRQVFASLIFFSITIFESNESG